MKTIEVTYGVGYGRHTTNFEIDDDATDEEIEEAVRDCVMERLDWGWEVADE